MNALKALAAAAGAAVLAASALIVVGALTLLRAPCTNAHVTEDAEIIVALNVREPSALVMGPSPIKGLGDLRIEKP